MSKLEKLICEKNIQEIKKLIETKGFNSNEIVSNDRTALSLAAALNYVDVMQCLLSAGADINKRNDGELQYTPLEEAAREGSLDAVKFLIENGADVNKGNSINNTALTGACICAEKEVLQYLISKGASIDNKNNQGQTALYYICENAKHWGEWTPIQTVNWMITQTADGVTKRPKKSRFKQHTEIFITLLQNGANVNLVTNNGMTPLMIAAHSNADTFIQPLIDNGAEVNYQNSRGFSALHAACDMGNLKSAKILIKNGANINMVDNDGFTPLLGAVISNGAVLAEKYKLTEMLMRLGADKSTKAKITYGSVSEGDSVLDVAKKLENLELINILNKERKPKKEYAKKP